MSFGSKCTLCVIALFLLALPSSPDSQTLALYISAAQQTVKIGSEIKLNVKLTNISDHVVNFFDRRPDCDYSVYVWDDRGNLALQTDYKRQVKCGGNAAESRNILVTLNPRESREQELIINRFYELTRPGNYSVEVSRVIPPQLGRAEVKSNIITITLTK